MIQRIFLLCLCLCAVISPARAQDDPVLAMPLEQRVAQMFMVTLHGSVMTQVGAEFLREWQPGGVVLFTSNVGNPAAMTQMTNDFQRTIIEAGGPPLLIAIDQEGGVVTRLTDGFTLVPTPLLASAAGDEMSYEVGALIATELHAVGINMNLAPVADLETNPDNPIITRRAYGNDPEITASVIAQVVRGTQETGVLATVKHFPGHGETSEDSHGTLPRLDLDRDRLDSMELVPFRAAIEADVAAVMVGHLWYPALDPERRPGSISPYVVTDLLRNELGFDGLIITDAMDMNAVDMEVYFADSMVQAVQAGVDLIALGPSFGLDIAEQSIQAVVDAVRRGDISEERINESVRRILAMKERYGLMEWQPLDPATAAQRVNAEAHTVFLDELYRQATTVAYDRNDLIPLSPERKITIVFLATRYQIYNDCQAYNPDITWVGISDEPSDEEIGWATGAARDADVVVVFTQNAYNNPRQQALVNALPQEKTVAVAIWSPYDWVTYPNVAAYIATYSPGRPAIPAVCSILFGELPAVGRLPLTLSPDLVAGSRAQ